MRARCFPRAFSQGGVSGLDRCAEDELLPGELPGELRTALITAFGDAAGSCPGGPAGSEAVIIPQAGVYIYAGADGAVELIACQNDDACTAPANVSAWRTERRRGGVDGAATADGRHALAAVCGAGHGGFLCGTCDPGHVKLKGVCSACDAFNWVVLVQTLLINLFIGLFLLHKSARPVISALDIGRLWDKVDQVDNASAPERGGTLDAVGLGRVLDLLGACVTAKQLKKMIDKLGTDRHGRVEKADFVRVQSAGSPTAAIPTAIFFFQTLALIMKETDMFSAIEVC
jgi:hypothetical protein